MIPDQNRRQKSREVSSRYLSPTVAPPSPPLGLNNKHTLSPNRHNNPKSSSSTKQKHKHSGFIRGLWPSSTKSHNENQPTTTAAAATLADHLGNERRKDGDKNSAFLSKQKSCSEFMRRNSEKLINTKNTNLRENRIYGAGSARFKYSISPSTSSSYSTKSSSDIFDPSNQIILPGRLSVDENALRRRSSSYSSDYNSENSDYNGSPFRNSPAGSYMAPTLSSKKSVFKTAMNRVTSISSSSEWESYSPSRLGLSPTFSSSKPPTSSPSGSRGRKNILHMGLDLIKGKNKGGLKMRSDSDTSSSNNYNNMENVHQLRLLQNSWMLWRYANARAQNLHENLAAQCENDLSYGCESVAKLRQSVVQKRLQLQKENLEMKLNLILHSQMKRLEAWGNIERRHILDISVLKDYLHAVTCMIPLTEGAKVDLESATLAFQHTSHLVTTIKSMLSSVSPIAHDTMVTISELAEVVTHEKLMLEECFEHLRSISTLEIQERNLRCSIIAMDSISEQQQNKQEIYM